ncbi:exodeoxyribonuclease VII small subunit [Guyparkeria hydrothermalis]|uniref:exodeoxyribonuclease VII small subunit n=1 Tax=Guyparkeria hydrothermalis TaxID=923 RepID=UPI0020217E3A|nr:exodeoxyribonuclease VII small subunit [Guyparkeria hydrothermalis]MCL7745398.1 exodeoxyribonuclease VII small subunit [Guyparkeria hydrothermalis]
MDSPTPSQPIPAQTVDAGDPSAIARYEKALAELEQIVARLESGEQSLEQSLKDYERGVELERQCQRALDEAERRVAAINEPPVDDSGDSSPSA